MINSENADFTFREIASIPPSLDKQEFFDLVVQKICDNLNLYFAGLYLVDSAKGLAVFVAGSGEFGPKLLSMEHRVSISRDKSYGWQAGATIGLGEIRLTNWKTGEIAGYSLPAKNQTEFVPVLQSQDKIAPFCSSMLPLTECELFLPLGVQGEIIGVLEVHSAETPGFCLEDIKILQLLADRIAIYL